MPLPHIKFLSSVPRMNNIDKHPKEILKTFFFLFFNVAHGTSVLIVENPIKRFDRKLSQTIGCHLN